MEEQKVTDIQMLKSDLNELIKLFNDLTVSDKRVNYINSQNIPHYNEYYVDLISKFDSWSEKFNQLMEKAKDYELINEKFLEKYEKYTNEDWKQDEDWIKITNEHQDLYQLSEKISALDLNIFAISTQQSLRNEYHYPLAAKITSITAVIPLIILIIYLIDKYLATPFIIKSKEESKQLLEKQLLNEKQADPNLTLKGSLYYQASFFKQFQKASEEAEKNIQEIILNNGVYFGYLCSSLVYLTQLNR